MSSWGQAGKGKETLTAKTQLLVDTVNDTAPGRLKRVLSGVEEGKLSTPRRHLSNAARFAVEHDCILVAADLSRFLRAEVYHRQKNRNAVPTPDEFRRLHEITLGVPLATLADPTLTEDQRHSLATRRTGKAGRPRTIDDAVLPELFAALGSYYVDSSGRWRWERPLAKVAAAFGVSPKAILREANRPLADGRTRRGDAMELAAMQGRL